jgi:hypothetical protein
MESVGWELPSDEPEKVWKAKAAYAFAILQSRRARDLVLYTGSNSAIKVVLNGDVVQRNVADRDAVPDSDTTRIRLAAGTNRLLIRVEQTHRNEGPSFFGGLSWQWGFYARLADENGQRPDGVSVLVPTTGDGSEAELVSTFFFREIEGQLLQRFDLWLHTYATDSPEGHVSVANASGTTNHDLGPVDFGFSRHALWLPAVKKDRPAIAMWRIGRSAGRSDVVLKRQPRYEIFLAMMSHTDIGYTAIQPVVAERHLRWLDDVVDRCDADSTFRWTIETVWQLEQYIEGRPKADVERLLNHVRSGRIAISPLYTNPYTGWVSSEEMARAFDKGEALADKYGFVFNAAVYNDVPGLSWLLPQVLNDHGVSFIATGINEVYGGYQLQRKLPKSFVWEGPGGGRVLMYRNEAYNEGQALGLEKDTSAVKTKLWERLNRLLAQGYEPELVLAIHTFGDNGPIPLSAAPVAAMWNKNYAWPRFRISTLDDFARAFARRHEESLPTLRGDWTSTWDVLYQGEPERMIRQRWTQHNVPAAETMASIAWLQDPSQEPLDHLVGAAYDNLLHFSGHGSGLEYGYGSPRDNLLTMAYREQYVQDAFLATTAALERSLFKLSTPEESFEGEGLFLFNTLNWIRDAPLVFEFPRENPHHYRPTDVETGEELPFHFSGHTLRFVARGIPGLGFKKIRLSRIEPTESSAVESDLGVDGCSIENTFYRIEADCHEGLRGVFDRRTGRRIAGARFGDPVKSDSLFSLSFRRIEEDSSVVSVIDQRPARLALSVRRVGHLFESTEFELWENVDAIGVAHTLDLTRLEETDHYEDYSTRFEFDLDSSSAAVDVAGGLLDPVEDRLPGTEHDAYSIRRGVHMTDGVDAIDWASIDSRVLRLRSSDEGHPVVFSNLVNNFPEDWNRWEPNDATLTYRYLVRRQPGLPGVHSYTRFAWEATVPIAPRYTWLRSSPSSRAFFNVDGNVVVSSVRREGRGISMRLMNPDTQQGTTARITSDSFLFFTPGAVDTTGEETSIEVTLLPGEVRSLELINQ